MSKRQSKTGVQHLVYQAKTGFQYYFTFPGYIGNHPQLPAQIRWSLGHDEALARDLAQYLNPRFEDLLMPPRFTLTNTNEASRGFLPFKSR